MNQRFIGNKIIHPTRIPRTRPYTAQGTNWYNYLFINIGTNETFKEYDTVKTPNDGYHIYLKVESEDKFNIRI